MSKTFYELPNAFTLRKINDAVVVPLAGDNLLCRIISFTESGQAIIQPFKCLSIVKVEKNPGEWPVCGKFVPKRGWFSSGEFEFVGMEN